MDSAAATHFERHNILTPKAADALLLREKTSAETVASAPRPGSPAHLHKTTPFRDAIKANLNDIAMAAAQNQRAGISIDTDDAYATIIAPLLETARDARTQNNPDMFYDAMDQMLGRGVVCRTYQPIEHNGEPSCVPSTAEQPIHLNPMALRCISADVVSLAEDRVRTR